MSSEDVGDTKQAARAHAALLDCDLVLKGGVTSGIVYPKAIARLAQEFRFRSIGGASAGAIGAAAAGAAEYRRQKDKSTAGFDVLQELPSRLGKLGQKKIGPTLLELFQPQAKLRPLFGLLLSFLKPGATTKPPTFWRARFSALRVSLSILANTLSHFPWHALFGAALAAVFAVLLGFSGAHLGAWAALAAVVLTGAWVFALLGAWRALLRLPSNQFGLCRGFESDSAGEDPTQLTSWFHSLFQEVSGRSLADSPLTFGDLEQYEISLRVVTSNLGYGHPHQLPFAEGEAWTFFEEAEWSRIFPRAVVEHLKRASQEGLKHKRKNFVEVIERVQRQQGLVWLPEGKDLPVLVAVRMSLSFPLLLSAVPVFFLDPSHQTMPARRCWLSDGGISSNFPLHLFDSPVPTRPTFAINLEEVKKDFSGEYAWLAKTNSDGLERAWVEIHDEPGPRALGKFLLAIFNTMQNWRDNSRLRLPGYRDRVASVRLGPDEGGLRLAMPEELIQQIAARGEDAAALLALHFNPAHAAQQHADGITTTWENHRWIRLLSTLAGMETLVGELERAWERSDVTKSYEHLLDPNRTSNEELPSYRAFSSEQRKLALNCIAELRRVLARQRELVPAESMTVNTPHPVLRFRLSAE